MLVMAHRLPRRDISWWRLTSVAAMVGLARTSSAARSCTTSWCCQMSSRIPGADTSRLYLVGESRGGAMVYMALRDGFPAKSAAVWGAFTDLEPLIASGPLAKAAAAIWPQYANDRETLYRTRSAMRFADRLKSPILIMHGGADDDIPLSQSQRLDAELTRLGTEHRFIVFEDQKHVIGGRGAERDAAVVAWFEKYGGAK